MIWDKRSSESQDKGFGSNFETIWSKTRHKRWILRHEWFGFFTGGEKREYEHPTTKPVKLLADILTKINMGSNIVDLFGGSGSTLIACEQLDRTCYMMELDPKYTDVIRRRYWKFVNNGDETGWEDNTPAIGVK
jgi:DNA modification methylase